MSVRYYLIPKTGDGSREDPFRPAYVLTDLPPGTWGALDFGAEPVMLVAADVTAGQHTTLAAHADLTAVPANIDSAIGAAALSTVVNKLEAFNIPATWITAATTYRQVLKRTAQTTRILNRLREATAGRLFGTGITLDTPFNQLSAGARTALLNAANTLGLDTSGVQGTDTLRAILVALAPQLPTLKMYGEVF
jgi:hypothetical protein